MRSKRRNPWITLFLAAAIVCLMTGCTKTAAEAGAPAGDKTPAQAEAAAEPSGAVAEAEPAGDSAAETDAAEVPAGDSAAEPEAPAGTAAEAEAPAGTASYEKAEEYLLSYYGIEPGQEITLESVNGMLKAVGGEPIEAETLSDGAVIEAGIKLAGLDELAQSYLNDAVPDKAAKVLEANGILTEEEYVPYVACAADLELYAKDTPFDVETFLYRCLEIAGKGRHYLGRVTDADLMEEMRAVLDSMSIFDNWELDALGTELVMDGIVTGYGLKYAGYDARFLDAYTLKYSHSDYQHAIQLVGLLRSEGMDAYVQIEPKVSIYEYLKEWGTPAAPSPTYAVQQTDNGRYLCYSVEYDLMIEFDSADDKEKFHGLIETYAKKYDDRVDENGNVTAKLLAESFWQPLYSSGTPMRNDEYREMIDNTIYDRTGKYSIHTFTLTEGADAVVDKVGEIAPELTMSPFKVYVNPAFVRYITGEDHQ